MSEAFDIYTLLFLVLAVVIFIRLRNVLGRRTGSERPPYDPYSAPEPKRGAPEANEPVVALPRGRSGRVPVEASGPSLEDIEARLGRHAAKDSPLGKSLTALMRADPGFDPNQFLDGAKAAYELIVTAFAQGARCSTASSAPSASARSVARRSSRAWSASTRPTLSRPRSRTAPPM
jgi:predicted lipid-binding transport protein (Tim44 family)